MAVNYTPLTVERQSLGAIVQPAAMLSGWYWLTDWRMHMEIPPYISISFWKCFVNWNINTYISSLLPNLHTQFGCILLLMMKVTSIVIIIVFHRPHQQREIHPSKHPPIHSHSRCCSREMRYVWLVNKSVCQSPEWLKMSVFMFLI